MTTSLSKKIIYELLLPKLYFSTEEDQKKNLVLSTDFKWKKNSDTEFCIGHYFVRTRAKLDKNNIIVMAK